MEPIVNIAVEAAEAAGQIIRRGFDRLDRINIENKASNDFVTNIDREAESAIIEIIQNYYRDKHHILGEESGSLGDPNSDYEWIIDPLDGTTNFIRGIQQFAVSIGIKVRGKLEHGVVFDPIKDELFYASRGKGAYLNKTRIRVADRKNFTGCLIGTGFPFRADQMEQLENYMGMFKAITTEAAGIRRPGAAALDLAYVAAGRLDGFWEMNLRPWDIAAGIVIVREAGGLVTDLQGGESYMETGNVLTANPKLFKLMLKTIAPFSK